MSGLVLFPNLAHYYIFWHVFCKDKYIKAKIIFFLAEIKQRKMARKNTTHFSAKAVPTRSSLWIFENILAYRTIQMAAHRSRVQKIPEVTRKHVHRVVLFAVPEITVFWQMKCTTCKLTFKTQGLVSILEIITFKIIILSDHTLRPMLLFMPKSPNHLTQLVFTWQ